MGVGREWERKRRRRWRGGGGKEEEDGLKDKDIKDACVYSV